MTAAEDFDSIKACERVQSMWRELGEKIAEAILIVVVGEGDPEKAIRWATCAEACFWKATGESDTHDVKDVLANSPAVGKSEE